MAKKTQTHTSILVISTGFLLIFMLKEWRWAAWLSLLVGIIGIASPLLSRVIHNAWMKLADVLGWFMPKILLGVVFYVFLFPIALLAGLFGRKDHLQLKLKPASTSTYSLFKRTIDKAYFEKPW